MTIYTCLKCDLLKDCIDKEHFTRHMVEFHQLDATKNYEGKMIEHRANIGKPHTMKYLYKDENNKPLFTVTI